MPGKVVVHDLVKNYGAVRAVRGVSFEVADGEIFGLLGPNGAGKTSTLECVIGLRHPDGGRVEVCGIDARTQPREIRERIGAVLQATALQDKIKCREALKLFASFYRNRAPIDDLLAKFSLTEKANARYETLSGGQKQRLALALALVNNPEFLLLDEPTAGLDPQSRRELHAVIRRMKDDGRTVLLTTHYIEEAQALCDRIAIIDRGVIIAEGTPRDLIARSKAPPRVICKTTRPVGLSDAQQLAAVSGAELSSDGLALSTLKPGDTIIDLVKYLNRENNELLDLHIHKPSLEDVFIELTGRTLRD
ncbi:MAG TPA: ABC transporter ATP-binding protein [Planctomycetota bacterium]|nr:ABC transporter ATP-binding protein [Planctomycetota bacterium]